MEYISERAGACLMKASMSAVYEHMLATRWPLCFINFA